MNVVQVSREKERKVPKPPKVLPGYIAQMSDNEKNVLCVMLRHQSEKGYIDIPYEYIASGVEVCPRTVGRTLKKFKDLEIVTAVNRRYNKSNFTYLNPYMFQNYPWYEALSKICAWMPKIVLSLSMIMPTGSTSGLLSEKILFLSKHQQHVGVYMGGEANQYDQRKGDQCRKIALALQRRGANLSNEEALSLYAYDTDVLSKASTAMKAAKNVQNPTGYFFSLCKRFTNEMGVVLDFEAVAILNKCKIRFLGESEEGLALHVPVTEAVKRPESPKQERAKVAYTEQVKQGIAQEKQAAEQRKSHVGTLDEEIAGFERQIIELKVKAQQHSIFQAVLGMAEKRLKMLYDQRDGVRATQGSTAIQKSNPVSFYDKEDMRSDDEEELSYQGECDSDVETEDV